MNNKQAKRIRRHASTLLVGWLRSLLTEEEGAKINIKNYADHMPEQTHIYANRRMMLNANHPKWIIKKINQLLRIYPHLQVEDVDLELVQWKANKRQA